LPCDDEDVVALPTGTVTLLLADIEGSTRLWESHSSEMPAALAGLDDLVNDLVARHNGVRPVELGEGDSFVAGFALASDAVACALQLQRATIGGLLVLRASVHTGELQQRAEGSYMGPTINRAARIRDAGHGGQVLMSQTTVDLVHDTLPPGCTLVDLGACRLRDLDRPVRLWQLAHADLPATFPPLRGLDAGRNNLPLQLTAFIGRAEAVAEVHEMLDTDRAVTLTGAGGCGKTRLALQVAAERVDRYTGGVWLVDLAPVNDAAAVSMLVADAIGASSSPRVSALASIAEAIGDVPTLVVIDNCEHLVDECAALVESMLRACSRLVVLATSREPLGFGGEVTFRVPSLSMPAPGEVVSLESLQQFDAVELFIDRARRAKSRFTMVDANAPVIGEICRRLDGIPLAIELAAARMRVLTAEQILDGLRDRFRLLTGGSRTAVPRHQTLQASVDWSYALLLEPERVLLQRLSVCAGGFTLEAAEAIGAGGDLAPHHVFDLLMQLVDKSLLVSDEQAVGSRFGMLETVRQYAAARLVDAGEANDVRRRHFDFYLGFAGQQAETTDTYRRRLDPDYDNLRRALQWADDQDGPEPLVRLASRLYGYWALGKRLTEGHQWLGRAVERAGSGDLRGRVLGHFAHVHGMAVGWAEAAPLAREAAELARASGRPRSLAWALIQLGNTLANTGQLEEAEAALREAIDVAASAGDVHGQAFALFQLGRQNAVLAAEAALALLEEADRLAASVGAEYIQHMSRACMSWCWIELGDLRRAIEVIDEAIEGLRAIGDGWFFSSILSFAAFAKATAGDAAGTADALAELAEVAREMNSSGVSWAAIGRGLVAFINGRWAEAAGFLQRMTGLDADVARLALSIAYVQSGHLDATRALLTEAESRRSNRLERGLALMRAELAFAAGEPRAAQDVAREFLLATGGLMMTTAYEVHALQLFAAAAVELDMPGDAIRLFGAAAAQGERFGMSMSTPFATLFGPQLDSARAAVEPAECDALWTEGAELDWDELLAYLARGRGTRRRPRAGWDSLTPTEWQVVELVVAGFANKAVAEKLLMSVPTVKSHLTHAYAKVGVASRGELIAALHRRQAATPG
jgi:predicted ATPase/class 3 adenylate cyclase/DNA-binding CsgD family transcriptional regulator